MKSHIFCGFVAACALAISIPDDARAQQPDRTIHLPGDDFYPEGIAIAPDGDVFVGSLERGEIWRIPSGGGAQRFADTSANLMSVIGVHVSGDGKRLYACSSDPAQRFGGRPPEVVVFDTASGRALHRSAFPDGGLCNDMTEMADGTILVTDSFHPRIFAMRKEATGVTFGEWLRDDRFAGEGISLNGIADAGDAIYVVKYSGGEMLRIVRNGDNTIIDKVDLGRPLAGPDGLELLSDGTLLVVEGFSGSLSRITLAADGLSGTVRTVGESYLGPTTVAASNGEAYVVQGQLDRFFGIEKSPPEPFSIRVTRIE